MNLLEILTGAAVEVQSLRGLLEKIAASGTDIAPLAGELLARVDAAGAAADFAALAVVLPKEGLNVVLGKFDGRFHPGGAA